MSFLAEFRAYVTAKTGVTLEKIPVSKLQDALGLQSISRESLRKLKIGEEPSPTIRARILEIVGDLSHQHVPTQQLTPDGLHTAQRLRQFLDNSSFAVMDDRGPAMSPDIVLRTRLGGVRLLIRCIDDFAIKGNDEHGEADDGYFASHVEQAVQLLWPRGEFDVICLVTNGRPTAVAVANAKERGRDERDRTRIELKTAGEVVLMYFDVASATRRLKEDLKDRWIDGASYICPIPADIQPGDVHIPDVLTYIENNWTPTDQLPVRDARTLLLVVGSAGTGKSSVCLLSAHRMLLRWSTDIIQPLPVIVRGSDLATAGEDDLVQNIVSSLNQSYGCMLSGHLVRSMLDDGLLMIFIDGLDESPACASPTGAYALLSELPQGAKRRTTYVVTSRPEIVESDEEEQFVLNSRRNELELIRLAQLDGSAASRALEARVGRTASSQLLSTDSVLSKTLKEFICKPLFLDILSRAAPGLLSRLDALRDENRQAAILAEIYQQVVSQWVNRERKQRAASRDLELNETDRFAFCKRISRILFRPPRSKWVDNEELKAETEISLNSRFPKLHSSDQLLAKFQQDARLSMLLERPANSNRLQFAQDSIRQYFLALLIVDELRDREYPTLASAPLEIEGADSLVPTFVAGILQRSSTARSRATNQLLDALSTIRDPRRGWHNHIRRSNYLTENIIILYCAACGQTSVKLSMFNLSCPFIDFSALKRIAGGLAIEIDLSNANVEFAIASSSAEAPLATEVESFGPKDPETADLPQRPLPGTPMHLAIDKITSYCEANGLQLNPEDSADGGDWLPVPGGVWRVGRYKAVPPRLGSEKTSRMQWESRIVGACEVELASFLIHRHPVTNGQFVRFVQAQYAEAGSSIWIPSVQRVETRNDYYLRGWDEIERKRLGSPETWTESDCGPDWWNAPIVYVSWIAAEAFAEHYGLLLPTEAQYEAACRMWQSPGLLDETQEGSASDHPWGAVADTFKGYAITAEVWHDQRLVVADCRNTAAFEDKTQFDRWITGIPKGRSPLFLTDLVREWMADVWEPEWPLTNDETRRPREPKNTGYTRLSDSSDYLLARNSDPVARLYRVLRGGSAHVEGRKTRISYRDAQPLTNVNPDAGFRCVQRIVPVRQSKLSDFVQS